MQESVHRLAGVEVGADVFERAALRIGQGEGQAANRAASHSSETGKRRASTCFQSRFWRSTPICRKKISSKARRSRASLQLLLRIGKVHLQQRLPKRHQLLPKLRTLSGSESTTAGAQYVTT